ncbi:Dihydrouridine synthase [Spironucleus salmonicida]|uniref:tRNA-dihydrouridine(47) synthase [NAD(P)(+)] n=1 Tax=Spironucleus salmonicida TaxID=348837 RepID=V6LKE8_9EUKA|nr:Dihydrouridine synthase [Spironucleus salmonicida]|eukprot:EST44823.1 Dihydrouridine synthase [Spironucleus salmonicida]
MDFDVAIKKEFLVQTQEQQPQSVKQSGSNDWHGTKRIDYYKICQKTLRQEDCTNPKCSAVHDIKEYLSTRPPLLEIPCVFYTQYGHCPYTYNCMYTHPNQTSPDNFINPAFEQKIEINSQYHRDLQSTIFKQIRQKEFNDPTPQELFVMPKKSLILAPMCTVGTIPFRRLCIHYGADITLSEMVIARSVVKGDLTELKKLRKHKEEKIFGIQLTGDAQETAQVALMIKNLKLADYVDLNAACPQDVATNINCGFAIANRPGKMGGVLRALDETGVNYSVKTRIGDFKGDSIVDRIFEKELIGLKNLRAIALHGRTAKQRYTKLADWDVLSEVNERIKTLRAENEINYEFIGNGDIYNVKEALQALECCDSVIIGRGALQKPWIFKEIKEGRELDLSSQERFEMLQMFCEFCVEYYGSDRMGIEKSREQFLENWNFMSRYVPLGICDEIQKLNERIPEHIGRDDLETLMGSQKASDWVKLSEMLFGPVPEGFMFQPKHKSKGFVENK